MKSVKFRRTVLLLLSILSLLIAFLWWWENRVYEPLLAFIAGIIGIVDVLLNVEKPDTETLEQRNRRLLLGHVENAWIKGVLDASLHSAALLDLGIKQDPDAVTIYPWAIKKESTDETLPAGTSILEIFDSIGMGRSLLILGAPGSGKTTMLLELARQLIARAREDVTYPIPMVFNLASWTEKLTLADWLAQELNNLYSVPRKTAPDWVNGNKLLLLLDGLDEVRQDSRAKCVEAINAFRKEHGLTSLAVCSRSQDYANLNAKLSFEGAIEVQPLTQGQIAEFFDRFGDEMEGIKQALEKDSGLREMAETPLFLSIMLLAYRDKRDGEILVSGDEKARRKHIFDNYIERMFEHLRLKNIHFKKRNVLHRISWLASNMITHNISSFLFEDMQPTWLKQSEQTIYRLYTAFFIGITICLPVLIISMVSPNPFNKIMTIFGLFGGFLIGGTVFFNKKPKNIKMVEMVFLDWNVIGKGLSIGSVPSIIIWIAIEIVVNAFGWNNVWLGNPVSRFISLLSFGVFFGMVIGPISGFNNKSISQATIPGQRVILSAKNSIVFSLAYGIGMSLPIGVSLGSFVGAVFGKNIGILLFLFWGVWLLPLFSSLGFLVFGGMSILEHYTLRFILAYNNLLPWKLVPFLDHCVDLIFLRRVGGGYIFVHRLLMEYFAEMYTESE